MNEAIKIEILYAENYGSKRFDWDLLYLTLNTVSKQLFRLVVRRTLNAKNGNGSVGGLVPSSVCLSQIIRR